MIYRYTLLITLIIISISLSAQGFAGGLIVGFNASQVDGDLRGGFNKAGLCVGGYVDYALNDAFSIQPEILFEQLGSRGSNPTDQFKRNLNFFTFPLLANLNFPMKGKSQYFRIQGGPAVGVLLSAQDEFDIDVTTEFRRTDLKLIGGFEYGFNSRLAANLRYGYSTISMVDGSSTLLGRVGVPFYNNYVSMSVRYAILYRE